jgi:hypothetical protein
VIQVEELTVDIAKHLPQTDRGCNDTNAGDNRKQPSAVREGYWPRACTWIQESAPCACVCEHPRVYTLTRTHSHSHSLPRSLTDALCLPQTLSISLTLAHYSHVLKTHSLAHSHTLILTHSCSLTHSHSIHSHSPNVSCSLTHSQITLTHTYQAHLWLDREG